MNGDLLNRKLLQTDGRLSRMLKDPKLTDETLVNRLYLLTFNRPPSPAEIGRGQAPSSPRRPSRAAGAQDLFWALLNSKEFLFNH